MGHQIASIGVASLGVAGAALDEYIRITKAKTAAYQAEAMAQNSLAHCRLGQAKATLNAARANVYYTLGEVLDRKSRVFNHYRAEVRSAVRRIVRGSRRLRRH